MFLWCILLYGGCLHPAPVPTVEPHPTLDLYVCDDFSSTNHGFEPLTRQHLNDILSASSRDNMAMTVYATSVTPPKTNAITAKIIPYTGATPDEFSLHFKQQKAAYDALMETNQTTIADFLQAFDAHFVDYKASITRDNDFSYIALRLRAIEHFLANASVHTPRIACISTDFQNHPKGEKSAFISQASIDAMNVALQNTHATLYIITDADTRTPPLFDLNATVLSSWDEFREIVLQHVSSSVNQ